MNSYFASVEQQANPFLRGKAVGVMATPSPYGCIIASSKEAKERGIKTGCRVKDALALDSNVILVEVDPPKYRSTTKKIFSILAQYSEDIETYSIDEAFVDLTGYAFSFSEAATIGQLIKKRIQNEVGEWLGCSMGLAPTRWLAKFASDTAPKGGLVILTQENLATYLQGRELTEAWGIAERMSRRLQALGIRTLDELKRCPVANLLESLGIKGYELWANVNGVDFLPLQKPRLPKSIGHSHVLRRRTTDNRFHHAVLLKLCEKTGRRLREAELEAKGFWLGFGTTMGGGGGARRFAQPTAETQILFRTAQQLFETHYERGIPTHFAVGSFDLVPVSQQLPLFGKSKNVNVQKALDLVNDRYGEFTITHGSMFGLARHHAPDRIGFRKTVSWQ